MRSSIRVPALAPTSPPLDHGRVPARPEQARAPREAEAEGIVGPRGDPDRQRRHRRPGAGLGPDPGADRGRVAAGAPAGRRAREREVEVEGLGQRPVGAGLRPISDAGERRVHEDLLPDPPAAEEGIGGDVPDPRPEAPSIEEYEAVRWPGSFTKTAPPGVPHTIVLSMVAMPQIPPPLIPAEFPATVQWTSVRAGAPEEWTPPPL